MTAWKQAAWESKLSLSAWIRNRCNDVVTYDPPEDRKAPVKVPKLKTEPCFRRLGPGTYCKQCGKTH